MSHRICATKTSAICNANSAGEPTLASRPQARRREKRPNSRYPKCASEKKELSQKFEKRAKEGEIHGAQSFLLIATSVAPVPGPIIGRSRSAPVRTRALRLPSAFPGWRAAATTPTRLGRSVIAARPTEIPRALSQLRALHRIAGLRILRDAALLSPRTFNADTLKWSQLRRRGPAPQAGRNVRTFRKIHSVRSRW